MVKRVNILLTIGCIVLLALSVLLYNRVTTTTNDLKMLQARLNSTEHDVKSYVTQHKTRDDEFFLLSEKVKEEFIMRQALSEALAKEQEKVNLMAEQIVKLESEKNTLQQRFDKVINKLEE